MHTKIMSSLILIFLIFFTANNSFSQSTKSCSKYYLLPTIVSLITLSGGGVRKASDLIQAAKSYNSGEILEGKNKKAFNKAWRKSKNNFDSKEEMATEIVYHDSIGTFCKQVTQENNKTITYLYDFDEIIELIN